jgi:uncharacterized protein YdaU (DUF1376 family)
MSDVWYPRYVGDYQRKTGHLSMMEHGAYAMLLDHYYSTGGLPANAEQLHRICRALACDEQAALQSVVDQFFTRNGDRLINKKAEEELAKRRNISEKRSKAAISKHAKQAANACANAGAIAHTTTTTTTIEEREDKSSLAPATARALRFNEFWNIYPHRDGVKRARAKVEAKYRAAVKSGVPEGVLIEAATRFRSDKRVRDGFACDPLTWFGRRGWEDEPAAPAAPDGDMAQRHAAVLDSLEAGLRGGRNYPASMFDAATTEEMIRRGAITREEAARRFYRMAAEPIRKETA